MKETTDTAKYQVDFTSLIDSINKIDFITVDLLMVDFQKSGFIKN